MNTKKTIRKAAAVGLAAITLGACGAVTFQAPANVVNAASVTAATFSLNKSEVTLGVGENFDLTLAGGKAIAETSFNAGSTSKKIAYFDFKQGLKAIAPGKATISIVSKSGAKATCKVTVKNAPEKITVSPDKLTLGVGEVKEVSSSVNSGAASQTRNYRVNDTSIIQQIPTSWNFKFKATKTGTGVIMASTYNYKSDACIVTVKPAPTKVSVTKTSMTLGVGETASIGSYLNDGAASSQRTYRTSDSSVIRMTKTNWTGVFKAVKPGVAWVTVKTHNGKEASCKITVKPAPTSVKITKSALSMGVGETSSLGSNLNNGAAASKRTFRSSAPSVVKMTKTNWTGEFQAVKTGVAWVTVRTYNGKESSCKITVKSAPTWIKTNKKTITMNVGDTATVSSYVNEGAASMKRTYASVDSSIVKMTQTNWEGKFKALKPGITYVSVKSYNGKMNWCKVIVKGGSLSASAQKEQDIIELINDTRVDMGIAPLKTDSKASSAARCKAQDLYDTNYLSMYSSKYGSIEQILKKYNVSFSDGYVQIGVNYKSVSAFFDYMYRASSSAAVINSKFDRVGAGFAGNSTNSGWTVFFIK